MQTAEQVLKKIRGDLAFLKDEEILKAMKEYACQACEEQRRKCSEYPSFAVFETPIIELK